MLAAGLAALGADNSRYVKYFSQYALLVIEDDLPDPLLLDSNGTFEPGSHLRNPKFMDWCFIKGVTPKAAANQYVVIKKCFNCSHSIFLGSDHSLWAAEQSFF